jgi:hypothetical protein
MGHNFVERSLGCLLVPEREFARRHRVEIDLAADELLSAGRDAIVAQLQVEPLGIAAAKLVSDRIDNRHRRAQRGPLVFGASRDKDLEFARDAAKLGIVRREELLARLESVTCTDDHRNQITARVNAPFR